jgi:hypothetical protein
MTASAVGASFIGAVEAFIDCLRVAICPTHVPMAKQRTEHNTKSAAIAIRFHKTSLFCGSSKLGIVFTVACAEFVAESKAAA